MLIPHFDILIAQIITFAIGMGAVWIIYFKPLGKHLKGRRAGIVQDLDAAKAARAETQALRDEIETQRQKLADEGRRLNEQTKVQAQRLRDELLAQARQEQEALLKQGRAQIRAESEEAVRQIRLTAATLIVKATGKLLEKNMNVSTQKALVEKFIKQIKISKN